MSSNEPNLQGTADATTSADHHWPHNQDYTSVCKSCGKSYLGPKRTGGCWECATMKTRVEWNIQNGGPGIIREALPEQMHEPLPVLGYKSETNDTVERVCDNKILEELVLRRCDYLKNLDGSDQRRIAMAKSQFEMGFMLLNAGVFNPKRILAPDFDVIKSMMEDLT